MRLLIVGAAGMLGTDLVLEAQAAGHEVLAPGIETLDITDPGRVGRFLREARPDACVNCAAYTAVDLAESEPNLARAVNADGPAHLARACAEQGSRLLHISTDYVFSGDAGRPYVETDAPAPRGVYATTKHEGERAVLAEAGGTVIRTAWLYGANGKSFPRTILNAYRAGKPLRVVADQVGSPTSTVDLARALVGMLAAPTDARILHLAGPEPMSWHELAVRTLEAYQVVSGDREQPIDVTPIRTDEWPTAAPRPAYSALASLYGPSPMRPVAQSLQEFCLQVLRRGD